MWWQWVIFAFVIVIVPFAIGYFCVYIKKRNKLTKEQEKIMNLNMAKYWLFYWLCDLFYMSFIIDNIVCKYIFGCLILIMTLYSLTMSFVSNTIKNGVHRICVLQDFIISIALTVYLIYITPGTLLETNGIVTIDNSLRDIITTIVAAVYGGLLTLVGVAWTIRKGDKDRLEDRKQFEADRKEEERKKLIPYLKIIVGVQPFELVRSNIKQSFNLDDEECLTQIDGKTVYGITIDNFIVKNISSHNILLQGILLDDKFYKFDNQKLLEVNSTCQIQTSRNSEYLFAKPLRQLLICVEDVIGNKYTIACKLEPDLGNSYMVLKAENGSEYQDFRYKYTINNLALPVLVEE